MKMKNTLENLKGVIDYLSENFSNLPNWVFESLGEVKNDLEKNIKEESKQEMCRTHGTSLSYGKCNCCSNKARRSE